MSSDGSDDEEWTTPSPNHKPQFKGVNTNERSSKASFSYNSPVGNPNGHSVDLSLSPIKNVRPFNNMSKIKAEVTNIRPFRQWANGEGVVFNVDLRDDSGEIRVTAFNDVAEKFHTKFKVGNVYYINKYNVKSADRRYSNVPNDYEIILRSDSEVERCRDDSSEIRNFVEIVAIQAEVLNSVVESSVTRVRVKENEMEVEDTRTIRPTIKPTKRKRVLQLSSSSDDGSEQENDKRNEGNESESSNRESPTDSDSEDSNSSLNSFVISDHDDDSNSSDFRSQDPYLAILDEELESKNKKSSKNKNKRKRWNVSGDGEYYKEVQEVSAHKIVLNKFNSAEEREFCVEEIEELLEDIIDKYNKPNGENGKERENPYKMEKVKRQPQLKEEDEPFFVGERFTVRVYIQEIIKKIGLLRSYGIHCESKIVHSIIFHYRKNELFALTTGQAWNVIQQYSDYDFPTKISARLLSDKGQSENVNKVLVGNERLTKRTMKEHQGVSANSLLELCTSFKAEIRGDSSISQLFAFQGKAIATGNGKERKIVKAANTKFQISFAAVRVLKRLSNSDFLSILSHFSVINKGEPTYTNHDNQEEKDTDVHKKFLYRVTNDMSGDLNTKLAKVLQQIIRKDVSENALSPYEICHKHVSSFSDATKFELWYKNKRIKRFSKVPSLIEIIRVLQRKKWVDQDLSRNCNSIAFLSKVNSIKLSFSKNDVCVATKDKLLNYIEGSITGRDGRPYWRVMSAWCAVRNEYLTVVHAQFVNILQMNYTQDKDVRLKQTWNEDYVAQYEDDEEFFIPEEIEGEEMLFDMVRVKKSGEFNLIYIASGLNHSILAKGSRLTKAIGEIARENGKSADQIKNTVLETFYDRNKRRHRQLGSGYKQFVDGMNDAKIIFAIAKTQNGTANEDAENEISLAKEKELKLKMEQKDIEEWLTQKLNCGCEDLEQLEASFNPQSQFPNFSREDLSKNIIKELKKGDYLNEISKITSKWLMAQENDVISTKFSEETNNYMYNSLIKLHKTRYNTLIPKLEFIRICKEVKAIDKEFFICEIDTED